MPRWEPNAVGRLHDAALDLFDEQGFDQTTVAQIAARAGLTERTFFNHFAAKREVLFGQTSEDQRQIVAREIIASPTDVDPLDAVVRGLQAAADEVLQGFHDPASRRRRIIDATPELREREEAKRAALAAAISAALEQRGVEADQAQLVAGVGQLVEQEAERRWVEPGQTLSLAELIPEAVESVRAVMVPPSEASASAHGR